MSTIIANTSLLQLSSQVLCA